MPPCGIILFAHERFISESKSQVYGILHDVFSKWKFHSTGNVSLVLDLLPKIQIIINNRYLQLI